MYYGLCDIGHGREGRTHRPRYYTVLLRSTIVTIADPQPRALGYRLKTSGDFGGLSIWIIFLICLYKYHLSGIPAPAPAQVQVQVQVHDQLFQSSPSHDCQRLQVIQANEQAKPTTKPQPGHAPPTRQEHCPSASRVAALAPPGPSHTARTFGSFDATG
jgi:hypothetical protein